MVRVLAYGRNAALVDLERSTQVLGLRDALRGKRISGIVELIPAARTLLVRYDDSLDFAALTTEIESAPLEERAPDEGAVVEIPVRYDGADLADVARQTELSRAEVVALHQKNTYVAAFCGFAPGFAYLTGLDPRLQLPRRESPRTRVPAGAVAVAGEYTAVYPRSSPGGWNLLGSTEISVWDTDVEPPNLLAPGTRVRFVSA